MRSFRSSGSVEGVMGNRHPYSDSRECLKGEEKTDRAMPDSSSRRP
jgi:hypothetical protein